MASTKAVAQDVYSQLLRPVAKTETVDIEEYFVPSLFMAFAEAGVTADTVIASLDSYSIGIREEDLLNATKLVSLPSAVGMDPVHLFTQVYAGAPYELVCNRKTAFISGPTGGWFVPREILTPDGTLKLRKIVGGAHAQQTEASATELIQAFMARTAVPSPGLPWIGELRHVFPEWYNDLVDTIYGPDPTRCMLRVSDIYTSLCYVIPTNGSRLTGVKLAQMIHRFYDCRNNARSNEAPMAIEAPPSTTAHTQPPALSIVLKAPPAKTNLLAEPVPVTTRAKDPPAGAGKLSIDVDAVLPHSLAHYVAEAKEEEEKKKEERKQPKAASMPKVSTLPRTKASDPGQSTRSRTSANVT